jgi:hypothetical protein
LGGAVVVVGVPGQVGGAGAGGDHGAAVGVVAHQLRSAAGGVDFGAAEVEGGAGGGAADEPVAVGVVDEAAGLPVLDDGGEVAFGVPG